MHRRKWRVYRGEVYDVLPGNVHPWFAVAPSGMMYGFWTWAEAVGYALWHADHELSEVP